MPLIPFLFGQVALSMVLLEAHGWVLAGAWAIQMGVAVVVFDPKRF